MNNIYLLPDYHYFSINLKHLPVTKRRKLKLVKYKNYTLINSYIKEKGVARATPFL